MKTFAKTLAVALALCLLLAVGAAAEDFSVTVPFNDTYYGYGQLDLSIGGSVDDGVITIKNVYAMGEDVSAYLTQDIYDVIEPDLKAALGLDTETAQLKRGDFAVTVPFNDTYYGYGQLDLSIGGTVAEDGTITVSYVYAMGEDVTSYLTQDIYDGIEPDLKAALGLDTEAAQLKRGDFAVTVPFNDTYYGYGQLDLSIGGTVAEDGTITVSYVYAMGEDVTSYLTQDIYAAIEADLQEAIGYEAGGTGLEPGDFSVSIEFEDTWYGYGLLTLDVNGSVSEDGELSILAISWEGEDVTSMLTDEIYAVIEPAVIAQLGGTPAEETETAAVAAMNLVSWSASEEPEAWPSVMDITEDESLSGVTMSSENGDENVIHVFNGASAEISDSSFDNTGMGSGGDAHSFYGIGATLLVTDGELYASGDTIHSDTAGGAGVFAYGDGVAYVYDCDIHTEQGSSGGVHVAGGGTLYAWDCDVETTVGSAAAIRSDRGGGVMVVDGGSYVSDTGTGAVYCTADITVHDAYLYSGASEAIAIEGKNTIRLFDCDLTGNMQPTLTNDNKVWNCIVYQSMSGDAEDGTGEFDMIGGSLTCNGGPVLYTTDTSCYITLSDVDVSYGEDTTYWLQCTGNSSSRTWGTAGANGSDCVFTAYKQEMQGDVFYDTISGLNFYMLDGSTLSGAFFCDDEFNGGYSGDGIANVYVDADSVWTVTGDSVISGTLYLEGTVEGARIVGADGTVYQDGEGFTVTVGGFETAVDASGAGTVPVWEDYAVENPFL